MTELKELLKYNKDALNRSEPDFYAVLMSTYELGASNRTTEELITLLLRYLDKEELLKIQLDVFIDTLVEAIDTFDIQRQYFKDFIKNYMANNTLGIPYAYLASLIRNDPKITNHCTIGIGEYSGNYYIEKRYN